MTSPPCFRFATAVSSSTANIVPFSSEVWLEKDIFVSLGKGQNEREGEDKHPADSDTV